MVQNQSKNSSYNKVAKELKDRRYHQRVVKSKKVYDRRLHKIKSRNSEREMSDV
jgi:anthranilate/para-aminobenzoate synthase component II